jgi:L-2-hydroxyglutarate oxidase LhgO
MESLLADAQAAGAVLATHSRLLRATHVPGSIGIGAPSNTSSSSSSSRTQSSSSGSSSRLLRLDIQDAGSGEVTQLTTRRLVNAAGLSAQAVAAAIQPLDASVIPRHYLAKGNYFSLSYKAPFSRLIYPIPEDGGLGVHLTLDLAGGARFGPDVEWVQDATDYSVDPRRSQPFYAAIRSYYPALPDGSLQPSYCGIRPKLSGPGQPAVDFVLQGPRQHGVRGLVNLFGIESPGLTSSLAIAQAVVRMLLEG